MSISKTLRRFGALAAAAACLSLPFQAAQAQELTVAYFLEWPTPNQVAQLEETYDRELGVKVNWKSFDNGNAMNSAMASGDVHISYSQGLVPFIVGTSSGLPIRMVGIAVGYADNDNCVVHEKNPLDRSTAASTTASLRGKKIGSPEGNVTHFKLLKTLAYFGLTQRDVNIIPMANSDVPAAFLTGQIDVGCAFGGSLGKLKEAGQVILTGAEQENVGIFTFDVVTATDEFAEEQPELLAKFMQVTEDANRAFAAGDQKWGVLAKASGLSEEDVKSYLGPKGTFSFPTSAEQLSGAWMGGNVQSFTKDVADFYVEAGVLPKALNSYDGVIDTSALEQVE